MMKEKTPRTPSTNRGEKEFPGFHTFMIWLCVPKPEIAARLERGGKDWKDL